MLFRNRYIRARLADQKINTSDIPEITSLDGGVRGLFYRPVTRPVTIRLSAPDVAVGRQLSKAKGLPYQTYIKMLLHEALEHAAKRQARTIAMTFTGENAPLRPRR